MRLLKILVRYLCDYCCFGCNIGLGMHYTSKLMSSMPKRLVREDLGYWLNLRDILGLMHNWRSVGIGLDRDACKCEIAILSCLCVESLCCGPDFSSKLLVPAFRVSSMCVSIKPFNVDYICLKNWDKSHGLLCIFTSSLRCYKSVACQYSPESARLQRCRNNLSNCLPASQRGSYPQTISCIQTFLQAIKVV